MTWFQASLLVMAGSALGGLGRYWCTVILELAWPRPALGLIVGTLLVNVSGSFAITLVAGWGGERRWVSLFVLTGIMGGFTTFSSFSKQSLELLLAGRHAAAGLYVLASLLICLLAAGLGYRAGLAFAP
ncbi:MAG: fluoride efflux transporter FluC [Planctomycetota bacterium]